MEKRRLQRAMAIILFVYILFSVIIWQFDIIPVNRFDYNGIILILILLVIVFSETYDNFSLGKLFTMSKTIKEKDSDIAKLSNQNQKLMSDILNIASLNLQHQSNTNIYGIPSEVIKNLSVANAEEEEIEKKDEEEIKDPEIASLIQRTNFKSIENYIFKKYIEHDKFYENRTFRNIKIQSFQGLDPVSDNTPIFDAYVNDINKDVFYEIKVARISNWFAYDKLYNMLTKIYYYQKSNQRMAYLHLYLVVLPEEKGYKKPEPNIDLLRNYFMPAIKNNLLFIDVIEITSDEYESAIKKSV